MYIFLNLGFLIEAYSQLLTYECLPYSRLPEDRTPQPYSSFVK